MSLWFFALIHFMYCWFPGPSPVPCSQNSLLEEQKAVMQKCAEERRKVAAEWSELHIQQRLSKERSDREVDRALQIDSQREGAIMSLAKVKGYNLYPFNFWTIFLLDNLGRVQKNILALKQWLDCNSNHLSFALTWKRKYKGLHKRSFFKCFFLKIWCKWIKFSIKQKYKMANL